MLYAILMVGVVVEASLAQLRRLVQFVDVARRQNSGTRQDMLV